MAGEVEAVGTSVTRFRPGDEVFGWCQNLGGAFAEHASVSADALERKPAGVDFEITRVGTWLLCELSSSSHVMMSSER